VGALGGRLVCCQRIPKAAERVLAQSQGRMLGDMDHDSTSLLPDSEGAFGSGSEPPPRQPNSKDAADALTQFAFRLQGGIAPHACARLPVSVGTRAPMFAGSGRVLACADAVL
jgi:hypothetical protein